MKHHDMQEIIADMSQPDRDIIYWYLLFDYPQLMSIRTVSEITKQPISRIRAVIDSLSDFPKGGNDKRKAILQFINTYCRA
jgi:plasmid stabilization system protein ParE